VKRRQKPELMQINSGFFFSIGPSRGKKRSLQGRRRRIGGSSMAACFSGI